MQEKVKQLLLNEMPIEESGLSYNSLSEDNFLPYLILRFPNSNTQNFVGQNKIILDALFKHSKVKSLREIDKQILKYKNVIKEITDSIDLVRHEQDKHIWSSSLIAAYVIAIEDQEFRNTLPLQHEREVLEKNSI